MACPLTFSVTGGGPHFRSDTALEEVQLLRVPVDHASCYNKLLRHTTVALSRGSGFLPSTGVTCCGSVDSIGLLSPPVVAESSI